VFRRLFAVSMALGLTVLAEAQEVRRAFIDGTGPGWRSLGEADFTGVNGDPDTWTWKDGVLYCSGRPIGVLRTRQKFTNVEMVVEWRHMRSAGNSGVFVWVPDEALAQLKPDARCPENWASRSRCWTTASAPQYEAKSGKKGDWFDQRRHLRRRRRSWRLPPLSPDGSRSFPRKDLSRGVGEWNHYYVRAINGELRLWVNGEEVSGGSGAEPRTGYLCMESEGSPVEFRTIRVRELP
jgi:hypothetical protein